MNACQHTGLLFILLTLSAALCHGTEPAADKPLPSRESAPGYMINIEFRIAEAPKLFFETFFQQKKGEPFSGEVTEAMLQALTEEKEADILSTPRLSSIEGQTAQIKVGNEIPYASGFHFNETNGLYELEMKTAETGISCTVVATPYPYDPERLHGAVEISHARLLEMREQRYTPKGTQQPLTLQYPMISTTSLTGAFDIQSGKTLMLGSLAGGQSASNKQTVVLMKAMLASTEENATITKLKSASLPSILFENATLQEVLLYLNKQAEPLNVCVTLLPSPEAATRKAPKISLRMKSISLYDAMRMIANMSGAAIRIQGSSVFFTLK